MSSPGTMGSLPEKLRSLLVSNNQIPDPLKDEMKLLIQELEQACTFLVDLSTVEAPNTMVKLWRKEVREMSYDLEDYIDKTTHPSSDEFEVEEFGILVELAMDAFKSYHRYNLGRLWPSNPRFMANMHVCAPLLNREETYVIGIDDARHKLISLLMNNAEQGLKVVPIHGPTGVGKTTLAQEVYREIGGEFDCRAFVWASRMPDTRMLLRSIISQIQHHQRPSDNYTVQKLIDSLKEYLQHKRYFIVIDGLWEITSWDIVKSAFPGGNCRSRVLITTDIKEVSQECNDYQFDANFLVEPLNRGHFAELLNNRLFCYKHEHFEQFKENLEDIIRTCGGLPLATISIANILASQPDNSQLWCQVKGYLSSRLRNNLTSEDVLREIVGLSFDCLSHDLKICLLYLSMYPEGYTFMKADLLKQWTAEGFICTIQGNANEVADSYFGELVCRGLIQPNHINFADTVVSYGIHPTMFEVIRSKSIEENFTTVIDYSNTIPELSAKVRRLSLGYSNAKYATKPEGITLSAVRSLVFYGLVDCLPSVKEFEVLRVLNLEFWGDQEELDLSAINQLFQLRYAQIRTDIIVKLPAEMKGLKYLETLEIYARVTSVPSDVVHLQSLLHLSLRGEINISDGINHMRSLRTLKFFDLSSNSKDNVWRLGEMTNLHDLHLTCSKPTFYDLERNLIALASSMGKLGRLNSLVLAPDTSCSSIYSDCSSRVSSPPISLQRLELLPPICIFSGLPKWIGQLRKLRILKTVVRQLKRDDVDSIAGLQELISLSLFVRKPSAEIIFFNRDEFPVLKYFEFRCGVLRLAFKAETMPSLQSLHLEFNAHTGEQYKDMLIGIENLLNIQEVAGRIGAIPGSEESDRNIAGSAFKDVIAKHSKLLAVNVQMVDWVDEDEEISQFSDLAASFRSIGSKTGKLLSPLRDEKIGHSYEKEPLSLPLMHEKGSNKGKLLMLSALRDEKIGHSYEKEPLSPLMHEKGSNKGKLLMPSALRDEKIGHPPYEYGPFSLLLMPKVTDASNTRYESLEDTVARADAWLRSSQDSGVPIVGVNLQTETMLTRISGKVAPSTVNKGSLSDLAGIANAGLYGFQEDSGVVRAVRLSYTAAEGETTLELRPRPGDTRLGFAISRTEEGFIYVSSVVEEDTPGVASVRSGLLELHCAARRASKLLVVSRVGGEKVLPWMASAAGDLRCFDTVSLSQKLSLHRHALKPVTLHFLMWDRNLAAALPGDAVDVDEPPPWMLLPPPSSLVVSETKKTTPRPDEGTVDGPGLAGMDDSRESAFMFKNIVDLSRGR